MSAVNCSPELIRAVEQIKWAVAPPPETNHRKSERRAFLQSYFMRQEDAIYSILRNARLDNDEFIVLTAAAQHLMCESEIKRFRNQTAFEGGWGRRRPAKARAHISDDLDYVRETCARLVADMQSHLAEGRREGAANCALRAIVYEGMKGIRIAALIELSGCDAVQSAKLAHVLHLADDETQQLAQP